MWLAENSYDGSVIDIKVEKAGYNRFSIIVAEVTPKDRFRDQLFGNQEKDLRLARANLIGEVNGPNDMNRLSACVSDGYRTVQWFNFRAQRRLQFVEVKEVGACSGIEDGTTTSSVLRIFSNDHIHLLDTLCNYAKMHRS